MVVHNGLVGMWCGEQEPSDLFSFPGLNNGAPTCKKCEAHNEQRRKEEEKRTAEIEAMFIWD